MEAGARVKNERAVSFASRSHRFTPEKIVTVEKGTIYVCRFQSQFVSNPVYVLVARTTSLSVVKFRSIARRHC